MSDTIELLEAIGRDASLRHASRQDLVQALDGMDASSSLKMAAGSGDRSHLAGELGHKINLAVQVNQNPHDGGCDPDERGVEEESDGDGEEAVPHALSRKP